MASMYEYYDNLEAISKKRYEEKLALIGLEQCPYKFTADAWINNPNEWPELNYHQLYHYLIKTPRLYSPEAMENFKSLDAWKFFRSGWVQTTYHLKLPKTDVVILRSDVRPSYRTTDEPHKPWVALKADGHVLTAHCNCMAGLGETCSHVGALLYKIEAAVRKGLTSTTPTEEPAKWNQYFVRDVKGCPVAQINLFSDEAKSKIVTSSQPRVIETNDASKTRFLESIHAVQPKTVGLTLFADYSNEFVCKEKRQAVLPKSLRELFQSTKSHEEIIENLKLSDTDVACIEESTRTQSFSMTWFQQRAGRITGSVIAQVYQASFEKNNDKLLERICQINRDPVKAPSLEWGRQHEKDGIKCYKNVCLGLPIKEKLLNDIIPEHEDFQVESIGLCVLKNKPWYGASPDSVIFCSCCGYGVLEIKCPFSLRDKSLSSVIENGSFYLGKRETGFHLKTTHPYYFQVQHEMAVSETKYCHFVVWTPSECVIVNVDYDKEFIEKVYNKCDSFWKTLIMPELIARKLESTQEEVPSNQAVSNEGNQTYCIDECELSGETDNMVGCDRCDNWFHPGCIGLKRLPRSKTWYCRECFKIKNA